MQDTRLRVEVVWACIEQRRMICRQESDDDHGGIAMEVPGIRRRRRPKRTWLNNINNDFSNTELEERKRNGGGS